MLQNQCSPLKYDGKRMPIESFHNLWRTPGFKYEYSHGRAEISVQQSAAPIVAERPSVILDVVAKAAPSLPDGVVVESAERSSVEELSELWYDTFAQTPDFYGYGVKDIQQEAKETLSPLFEGEDRDLHPSSVVARRRGKLIGMLLVNRDKTRPLIEALGVEPYFQHRGVGKAMVREVAKRVREGEERLLCSGYLLANDKSAGWHHAVGFEEIPGWLTTTHRLRCAEHNLKQGLIRDVSGMKRYVEMLRAEVKRMGKEMEEDRSAHSPFRWLNSDGKRIDEYLSENTEARAH